MYWLCSHLCFLKAHTIIPSLRCPKSYRLNLVGLKAFLTIAPSPCFRCPGLSLALFGCLMFLIYFFVFVDMP
jgi:hypothetical protein